MTGMCQDRVCVVTGAARGIGRAHAEALAAEGALVVVNDVDGAAVDEAVAALQASGADTVGHVGDASTVDGAVDLIGTAVDRWSRLDVVVNNAGITRDRMLWNLEESDWDDVLRVHAKSTFLVTREAARHWRVRSKAGDAVDARVINTVSATGLYGNVGQTNYAAAKGAIASFTIVASMELARIGVTVNAVCPTALTDMTTDVLGATDDAKAGALDPRWVSPAVVWLASPLLRRRDRPDDRRLRSAPRRRRGLAPWADRRARGEGRGGRRGDPSAARGGRTQRRRAGRPAGAGAAVSERLFTNDRPRTLTAGTPTTKGLP